MNVSVSSVSGQSSDNWQTITQIFQNPLLFSSNRDINMIIGKLGEKLRSVYGQVQLAKERRQALWILVVVLFVYGWDDSDNRRKVLNVMRQWEIDEAVFHEMKDTVEAYRVITREKDKNDLDKSIKDLIELG